MHVKNAMFCIEDMILSSEAYIVKKIWKSTKREFFRDLKVGDVIDVIMPMYLPTKTCIGKPHATEMRVRNLTTDAVYDSTLTVVAQALSQLELKKVG